MYNKIKEIEFKTTVNMVKTMILPAIAKHISQTAQASASLQSIGLSNDILNQDALKLSSFYQDISFLTSEIEKQLIQAESFDNENEKAFYFVNTVCSSHDKLRNKVDEAESVVEDSLWPIAKYQDLLSELG